MRVRSRAAFNGEPSKSVLAGSTGTPASLILHTPVTSKFSSASPIGSIIRWHDAHAALARCASSRSRTDRRCPSLTDVVASRPGTFGGGGGGGVPSITSITHFPRMTGDVRSAFEVIVSSAPLPRRPRR
jgi:hypothetical protein